MNLNVTFKNTLKVKVKAEVKAKVKLKVKGEITSHNLAKNDQIIFGHL